MKKIKMILLTLFVSMLSTGAFAHALWIETAGTGQVGKAQTVKVFYGEFAEGQRDSVAKWYSDIKDFELWLVGPNQQKVKLQTSGKVNYYEAAFTPSANGIYTLAVSHKAKELGGNMLYHFLASAAVVVGTPASATVASINSLQLQKADITSVRLNKSVTFKGTLNNSAAGAKKVSVFSPNGWTKELTTDANGSVSFTPPFAGRYVLEISEMDKAAGEHYGKPYTESWSGATYSFEVK